MIVLFQNTARLDLKKCAYINSQHIHCACRNYIKKVNCNKWYKYVTLRTAQTVFVGIRIDTSIPTRCYSFTLILRNVQFKEGTVHRLWYIYVAVLIIAALFTLSLLRVQNTNTKAFPKLVHACLYTGLLSRDLLQTGRSVTLGSFPAAKYSAVCCLPLAFETKCCLTRAKQCLLKINIKQRG
jgi:hypothetical protein